MTRRRWESLVALYCDWSYSLKTKTGAKTHWGPLRGRLHLEAHQPHGSAPPLPPLHVRGRILQAGRRGRGAESPAGTACRRDGDRRARNQSLLPPSGVFEKVWLQKRAPSFHSLARAAPNSRRDGYAGEKLRFLRVWHSWRLTAAEVINNSWDALLAVPKKQILFSFIFNLIVTWLCGS